MDEAVAVRGLGKRYGPRVAVDGVSLALRGGDVVGLLGGNGAGKTTTLRMLAGILPPDAGAGHVLGFDLAREAREVRRRVGYMAQRLALHGDLSVLENLDFRARVFSVTAPRAAVARVLDAFALGEHARTRVRRLSEGWARRAQLAAALVHAPRLLLLDEPTAGLDVVARLGLWRHIERLALGGVAVVVSTHDLAEAAQCGRALCFRDGRVVATGTGDAAARRLLADATQETTEAALAAIDGVRTA